MRYVECFTYQLPGVLSPGVLSSNVFPCPTPERRGREVRLAALGRRWAPAPPDDERAAAPWLGDSRIERVPRYSEWLPRFDEDAVAFVSAVPDPANSEEPGKLEVLDISFNERALAAIGDAVANAAGSWAWDVELVRFAIPCGCPTGHVIVVFRPTGTPDVESFAVKDRSGVSGRILPLWPVFHATLDAADRLYADDARRGGPTAKSRRGARATIWSDQYHPFGIPPALRRRRHENWDPSEEYVHEVFLFFDGDASQAAGWSESLGMTHVNADADEVVYSSWANHLWHSAGPPTAEDVVGRVLRHSLAARILKEAVFIEDLGTTLLEGVHGDRPRFSPRDLRTAALHHQILAQRLSARRLLLSEFDYKCVDHDLELCRAEQRYLPAARHMTDTLVRAAEGLEADAQRRMEVRIQVIGLLLACLTIAAVLMDGYNFLLGQPPTEPDVPLPARGAFARTAAVAVVLTVAILGLVFAGALGRLTGQLRRALRLGPDAGA